jgi:ADP-ribose pyrophosphatase YjhB (NUDIX family)
LRCPGCKFTYFHNTASAVAAIITTDEGILLVKRNHHPKKGYWDLPGGFVDYHETAEEAIVREIREELGCALMRPNYFASFPNTYVYAGVTYFSCDVFFIGQLPKSSFVRPNPEIAGIAFVKPSDLDISTIGFPSMKAALIKYAAFVKKSYRE